MQGRRNGHWQRHDLALRELGLNSTVALASMIARLCFILLRKEINFEPGFRSGESAIGEKIVKLSWQDLPDFILSRHHFEKTAMFVCVYLLYSNFKRPDDPHCCSTNGKPSCSTPSAGP